MAIQLLDSLIEAIKRRDLKIQRNRDEIIELMFQLVDTNYQESLTEFACNRRVQSSNPFDQNMKIFLFRDVASTGNLEMLKYLIKTNPRQRKTLESHILTRAIVNGSLHFVQFLIQHILYCSKTTLHTAIESGNLEIYRYPECLIESVNYTIDHNRIDLFKELRGLIRHATSSQEENGGVQAWIIET
ncbi:hypothetical protein DFA_06286 [Cavenderia fasciculata]|uniref:Ankyrin repeat-containing protein n=1 Tax=Cavenderia fasciculata TaxID=261658 RepID=F4PKL8_CACFS|nr:uncharacterized protein DFA_06286 [Cavenderia fasciculata]EGG24142.1 hypothetical protein DFA_06286 [Cavenderia fasciculata]|eukprot:XP_004361993.1 hypothetical protein DFA_06286 [Cavenderia fasciculata]